jgi:outer membrane lipoprotein SlyB
MNTNTLGSASAGSPGRFFGGRFNRNAVLLAGGLALACLGVAAGLAWHPSTPADGLVPATSVPAKSSLAANEALVEPAAKTSVDKLGTPVPPVAAGVTPDDGVPPAAPATQGARPVPAKPVPHPTTSSRVAGATGSAGSHANTSGTSSTQVAAAVCAHCGVVESVHEVMVKGKGSGVGAVAGGVVGGAVGNQFGHGNGRAAMTILGALGGGLAGNEIEKRTKAEKFYDITVRMDDGHVRTVRQKSAPTTGSRVTVENNVVRSAQRSA